MDDIYSQLKVDKKNKNCLILMLSAEHMIRYARGYWQKQLILSEFLNIGINRNPGS